MLVIFFIVKIKPKIQRIGSKKEKQIANVMDHKRTEYNVDGWFETVVLNLAIFGMCKAMPIKGASVYLVDQTNGNRITTKKNERKKKCQQPALRW